MAEYIEREALLKDARKNRAIGLCEADIVDVQNLINSQPTADVVPRSDFDLLAKKYTEFQAKHLAGELVEVVRCKDCKHSWFNGTSLWLCQREGKFYCPKVAEDAFCSYGERKGQK